MKQIAVFASGNGSNFAAIHAATINKVIDAEVALLICDNPDAYAIHRAAEFGIECFAFKPKMFASKVDYETEIVARLNQLDPDLIVLAGYMRILGHTMLDAFGGRIINIHPSLLPDFKGKDAIGQAIASKAPRIGVSIHYVDEGMDTGTIIAQSGFAVDGSESRAEIECRVHEIEHQLYPQTIAMLLEKETSV
ncbi:phosphoribosylglycinamide formyltransferase [Culicoidibacter larvae]|uniref:Phosphoribosylglycinamide formyltransferase n=1 Tax=Culicoidibacter larvae TaxID=2579976 RepID=A0A5R8QCN7_9FIRM|nr:phosphoribosylglycinamide formyltransferase [Culicoidibacter larvae]TLG74329.1 phosphoribosylglycinamide formyltransferase [Culicoidibacter larvae]